MNYMDERAQEAYDDYKERQAEDHVLREEEDAMKCIPPWPDDVDMLDEDGNEIATSAFRRPTGPPFRGELTRTEHRAMELTAELSNSFGVIVAHGPTRDADLREITWMIHNLQARILMQAAARAYPDMYRLLGGVVGDLEPF